MKQNWQNEFLLSFQHWGFFYSCYFKNHNNQRNFKNHNNQRKKVRIILLCKGKDSASYFNKDNSYCIFYDYKHDEIRINQFLNEKLSTILTKKNYSTLVYKRIGYFNDPELKIRQQEYIPVSHNIAVLIFPPKNDILSCYFHMSLKAIQKACIRLVFLRNINLYTEKPSKQNA